MSQGLLTLVIGLGWLTLALEVNDCRAQTCTMSEQGYLFVSTIESTDYGSSVAISAEWVVVGMPSGPSGAGMGGRSYMFINEGGEWNVVQELSSGDGECCDKFGAAASIDGNVMIVGSPEEY